MKKPVKWILASGSPRRRELLARITADFEVHTADVPEWEPETADPAALVLENASLKGAAVAEKYAHALVIAADTTVAFGERIFAKPAHRNHAQAMLRALSGKCHQVLTGVALFFDGRKHSFYEASEVQFKELSDAVIDRYLELVNVYDKAGSYAIQEQGDLIIERYSGSFENIMGLPVQRLRTELVQLDWVTVPDIK